MMEFSLELVINNTEVAIVFVVSIVCYKVCRYIYSLVSSADNSNDEEHSSIVSPPEVDDGNVFDHVAAKTLYMREESVKENPGKKIEKSKIKETKKYKPKLKLIENYQKLTLIRF